MKLHCIMIMFFKEYYYYYNYYYHIHIYIYLYRNPKTYRTVFPGWFVDDVFPSNFQGSVTFRHLFGVAIC